MLCQLQLYSSRMCVYLLYNCIETQSVLCFTAHTSLSTENEEDSYGRLLSAISIEYFYVNL